MSEQVSEAGLKTSNHGGTTFKSFTHLEYFVDNRIHAFQLIGSVLIFSAAYACSAQQSPPAAPPPQSPTSEREIQDPIRIFTQEVRLPVVAYDDRERFDPTLVPEDILVVEDGVPQIVRSVRRVPANILLVFDMGSQVNATRNSDTTRKAALRLVQTLRPGDQIAIVQNGGRIELVQDWTTDMGPVKRWLSLTTKKFFTGNRSRLSDCVIAAAIKLREQPIGNTHIIIFTDGLEIQSKEKVQAEPIQTEVLRNLVATQASVHLFGFAAMVEEVVKRRNNPISFGGSGNTAKLVIDTDREMRRWFKNYALAMKQREKQLIALGRDVGGRVLLPATPDDVIEQTARVSRDIEAQYVVTYQPRRAFTEAAEDRRRIGVFPRRIGLKLISLRSFVTPLRQ